MLRARYCYILSKTGMRTDRHSEGNMVIFAIVSCQRVCNVVKHTLPIPNGIQYRDCIWRACKRADVWTGNAERS
jgi:hypothetical protein